MQNVVKVIEYKHTYYISYHVWYTKFHENVDNFNLLKSAYEKIQYSEFVIDNASGTLIKSRYNMEQVLDALFDTEYNKLEKILA